MWLPTCHPLLSIICCAPGTRPAFSLQPHGLPASGPLDLLVSAQDAAAHPQCQRARLERHFLGLPRYPQAEPALSLAVTLTRNCTLLRSWFTICFPARLQQVRSPAKQQCQALNEYLLSEQEKGKKIDSLRAVGGYWQVVARAQISPGL